MKQSQLFTKTRREGPKDEVAKNAELLIRGGFVHKELAGVYSYLPLGLRVLNKINDIIREEMNVLGAQELYLSAFQNPEIWRATGRWDGDSREVWFKTELVGGSEIGLGWTHEEAITAIARNYVSSYRDLPFSVYQIQTKFRNEARAKSGLLRGREFLMKDLYSFARTPEELDDFYERVIIAYEKIFTRVGVGDRTYRTFASGGAFSKYSHEFQTLCEAGEDTIYVDEEKKIAVNLEVCTPEVLADLGLKKEKLMPRKAIEVGNIFKLGTRFSETLGLKYRDETGVEKPVVMGSYGIGPGRLMGTAAETLADDQGLVWPKAIAPFTLHLIELKSKNKAVEQKAAEIYHRLTTAGEEVLWDEREVSAGEKFADSDLLGIPERLVVSEKTLETGQFELKNRQSGAVTMTTNYAGTIL
jgi:prolyl-tRNA synthetase